VTNVRRAASAAAGVSVRRTFAAEVGPGEGELPEAARDVLRAGSRGEKIRIADADLRAGPIPLFRRDLDGGMSQGVQVAGRGAGRVELSLLSGETTVDRATLALGKEPSSCHLFAPAAERRLTLAVGRPGGLPVLHPVDATPQRQWTVFLIHHSHLDIGYTDLQPVVLRHHRAYLDSALDLVSATDGWPDDARFRWNVESNLPLRRWLDDRPPARVAELVERTREGRLEVCALPFTSNVEACAVEELALQLGWARSFGAKHGVEVVTAMQTDVPGHGYGLPRLLLAAGIPYLDVAHNYATRAAPHLTGGFDLPRLFRWGGRDGVVVWHTDSPRGVAYLEGNLLGLA